MKRNTRYIKLFMSAVLLAANFLPARVAAEAPSPLPAVIISEVQTGGLANNQEDGGKEFIELFNTSSSPVDMAGLRLEYYSASHSGGGPPTRSLANLSGVLAANSFAVVSHAAYVADAEFPFIYSGALPGSGLLARSGGQLRLVAADGQVKDAVTWGSAAASSPWWKSVEIPAGQSIQRSLPGDPDFSTGFTYRLPTADPTIGDREIIDIPEQPEVPVTACPGVYITEILPNAEGADAGKEFVEIHNPTDVTVSLLGCRLYVGSAVYELAGQLLGPGAYLALYDSQTQLTLPNATAQAVSLITVDGEQYIQYANNMADDQAWALIDDSWQSTAQATPGAANVLALVPESEPQPKPPPAPILCGLGKERNPLTNRCRTIAAPAAAMCPTGQTRNVLTNRCRKMTATTILAACKPGQTRNPETGRCRAGAATSGPKPCPTGQERHSETKRCRKIIPTADTFASVTDVSSGASTNNYRWLLAGGLLLGVIAYAAYEWRHDVRNALGRCKNYALLRKPRIRNENK